MLYCFLKKWNNDNLVMCERSLLLFSSSLSKRISIRRFFIACQSESLFLLILSKYFFKLIIINYSTTEEKV
jgi:hypothetical protein